jgi:hypothetical protein
MRVASILFLLLLLPLAGCVTNRATNPPRTATEQLLISSAADRAIDQLHFMLPRGTRVFLDVHNFTAANGDDAKYAAAVIEDRLLLQGMAIMPDAKSADVIMALRSSALAANYRKILIGIPAMGLPIPLAGTIETPEVAFFSWEAQKGVAQLAATNYGAHDGTLRNSTGSVTGVAKHNQKVILFFFGSTRNNLESPIDNRLAE